MSKTSYITSLQGMPILADRAKKTENGTNIDSALGNKQNSLPASGTTPITETYAINIDGTAARGVAKIVTKDETSFNDLLALRNNGNIIFLYTNETFSNRKIILPIPLIRVDFTDNTFNTIQAFVFGYADFTDSNHFGKQWTITCDKDNGWSSTTSGEDITHSKSLLSQYNQNQTDFNDYGMNNGAEYRSANAGQSHAPNSTGLFDVLTFGTNASNKTQIAFERFSSGNTAKSQAYIRYKTSSGWSNWSTFLYSNGQSDLFTSGSRYYGTHSANDAKSNGMYYCGNQSSLGGTGMPACIGQSDSIDGALISLNYSGDWGSQIAQDYRRGDLFVRGRRGSAENADNRGHAATTIGWSDWKQVVTMPVAGSTQQAVGSSSIPAYVDSNGQVQPCTTSSMSVGSATKDGDGNTISGTYLKLAGGTMTGTISTPENAVCLNFRSQAAGYYTTASYQTDGNEALVFATKNPVTSFMFVNGEDSVTNHGSNRWTSLTPGLQVKNNCVSIGKLIANNVSPTYKLEVNGTVRGTSYNVNGGCTIQYNSTDSALDFVFA